MSNRKQLILLNTMAIFVFVLCWIWLDIELSEQAMFFSADSKDYLGVAEWIFSGTETTRTITRPLLYPTLIGIPYLIFGITGIWVLHFACWLLTINLTFLSVKKWTKSQVVGWISAAVVIMNLSFIVLTFQGLTEVVTTALLSVLCYHVVSYSTRFDQAKFGEKLLFIFVLLTLIKPSFYYPALICLVLILFGYRKHYLRVPKKLIYPLLIMIPILLQMTLVQVRHGDFTVSTVGELAFKNYYFSQCVRDIENIEDTQKSKDVVNNMSSEERSDYILENKGVFVFQFVENIVLNIKSEPVFLDTEFVERPNWGYSYMKQYNNLSLALHLLGSTLLVLIFLLAFFRKEKEKWIPLLCVGGLSSYYLFTTGISFWQGDRLVLPSIALWVPLYATLFFWIGSKMALRRKT